MIFEQDKFLAKIHNHLVGTGIFFIGLFWLIESILHCYFVGGHFLANTLYPDGHELWMRFVVVVLLSLFILYGKNAIDHVRQFESDLAVREKETQQILAELHQIFRTASVGMRLIDRNFNIVKINETFSRMVGVVPENAVGRKCFDIFAGNMCHSVDCPLQMVLDGREVGEYEVSKTLADGSVLICNLTVSRFEEADGNIGIVEAFKDITEFRNIQNILKSERDLLHRILFQQLECVGIVNSRYILEYQNEVLKKRASGKYDGLCYEILREMKEPCPDCLMQKAILTEKIQRHEYDNNYGKWFQCTYTPFVDNNGEKKALVSCLDITESKNSIAAAIHSERLAELGELAAGVAHEINNPINGIINYAQIIANKTQPGDQMNVISHRIIREGDRIAGIVASLLSFSRQGNENRCLIGLEDLLRETLTLTGAQLRKDGIVLSVNIKNDLSPVFAVAQEIEQVFLNIINNSRYALNVKYPHGGEMKKLAIDIGVLNIDGDTVVRTSFTDYGTGIPAKIIEKVCNPFFSTKPTGKGTGLGLTISHKIIDKHGGNMFFESTDGEHTRVVVDLPVFLPN